MLRKLIMFLAIGVTLAGVTTEAPAAGWVYHGVQRYDLAALAYGGGDFPYDYGYYGSAYRYPTYYGSAYRYPTYYGSASPGNVVIRRCGC